MTIREWKGTELAKSEPAEYFIRRISSTEFEVAKFASIGGDQPLAVYKVVWDAVRSHPGGRCNCPAASYRGTGASDKHVVMVKHWVAFTEGKQHVVSEEVQRRVDARRRTVK